LQKENDQKLKLNKKLFFSNSGTIICDPTQILRFYSLDSKRINVETVKTIVVGDQFMKNILPKLKHFYFKSTVQSFLYPELAVPDPSGYLEMYKYTKSFVECRTPE
jgi:hypothetical protein